MASKKVLLISLALLVIAVQYGSSKNIRCYECGFRVANCSDSASHTWRITNCNTSRRKCAKISTYNGTVLSRGCVTNDYCRRAPKCKSCKSNYCNSGLALTPLSVIAIVGAAIARFH